jgi:hypothetical protein
LINIVYICYIISLPSFRYSFRDVPENSEKQWNPRAVRIERFIFGGKLLFLSTLKNG